MTPYSARRGYGVSGFIVSLLMVMLVAILLTFTFEHCVHAEPRPAVIMPPSGQPIYVHPAPAPTAPAVVLPPTGVPIYMHPAPSAYAPATVIIPGEMPIFVYPGVSP